MTAGGNRPGETDIHVVVPARMSAELRRIALATGALNRSDVFREALAEYIVKHNPDFPAASREIGRVGYWRHRGMEGSNLPTVAPTEVPSLLRYEG